MTTGVQKVDLLSIIMLLCNYQEAFDLLFNSEFEGGGVDKFTLRPTPF